jgi:hypothetical protein
MLSGRGLCLEKNRFRRCRSRRGLAKAAEFGIETISEEDWLQLAVQEG